MISQRFPPNLSNPPTAHHPVLIHNLTDLHNHRVKIAGVVLATKFNDSYLDMTITDGTGDMECSVFIDKRLKQFYEIPKVGELLFVLGTFNQRVMGSRVFSKVKVARYEGTDLYDSVSNNLDEYLELIMAKLVDNQQERGAEVVFPSSKKKPTVNKLLPKEARNMFFIAALRVFEMNPEYKHWSFSKQAVRTQVYVKKYLTSKSIKSEQAEKAIAEAIQHYMDIGMVTQLEDSRYSINLEVITTMQQEALRVIQNCGGTGINYGYLIELVHRKIEVEKEEDFVFNAEGLSRLMNSYLKDGSVMVHENRLVAA